MNASSRSAIRKSVVQDPVQAAHRIIELEAEVKRLKLAYDGEERSNRKNEAALRAALEVIRDADPVDMALDPNWPARIARRALRDAS